MNFTNNPWAKKTFNLTQQMMIEKADPKLAQKMKQEASELDAEERRKTHTRSLAEFNEMDKDGKINFIRDGGEVTGGTHGTFT